MDQDNQGQDNQDEQDQDQSGLQNVCMSCGEKVRRDATICRDCRADLQAFARGRRTVAVIDVMLRYDLTEGEAVAAMLEAGVRRY